MRMYRTRALAMEVELKHIIKAEANHTPAIEALKELRLALDASKNANSLTVKFDSSFIRPAIARMTDPEHRAMKKEKDEVIAAAPRWEEKPKKFRPWNQKAKKSVPQKQLRRLRKKLKPIASKRSLAKKRRSKV